MRTMQLAFVRCTRFAAPAAAAGAAVVWSGHAATGSAAPWLHVAALLPVAASGHAALSLWPLFANDTDARDLVRRATRPPLHGMPTVALASLLAAVICMCALAFATAPLMPAARSVRALQPVAKPILDGSQDEATFVVDAACAELRLQPAALLPPNAPEPTEVAALVDGIAVGFGTIAFGGHRQLAVVPLEGRHVGRVTLRRMAGNIPLVFDREGASFVEAAERSRLANCVLALLVAALPLSAAMGIAMLTAPVCGHAVQTGLCGVALVVQTAGQAGPSDAAITLCARGRWIGDEGLGASCAWTAAVAVAAAALAATLPKEARR